MKKLLAVGGLGFVIAIAITLLAVRAVRQARRNEDTRRRGEEESRLTAEAHRRAEQDARLEARRQRGVEEEARVAAEAEAWHRAEEESRRETGAEALRRAEEQARVAAEADARHRADEEARLNAEADARRKAEEETRRESEGDARLAPPTPRPVAVSMAGDLATPTIPNTPVALIRAPRQYWPVARVPAVPAAPRPPVPAPLELETRDRALPIEVRLVFEKAGFCRVSLLPRRADGMPTELVVTGSGDPPELLALQDDWYQDVVLPNLGQLLREGIEWAGSLPERRRVRASLSGREIYVLARHNELNGFVSAPRLVLGEEHVVLCVAERLAEVRAAIALTGSTDPVLLSSDSGIPPGWAGLRGIVPRNPIAPSPIGEILDALRPLADVEIALVGGIRIDRQTWLTGFPPSVRLRGDTSTIGAVTIEGHEATVTPEGDYIVPGWDSPGDHSVWCTSGSRTYSIRSGAEEWEAWDAYTWSLGELAAEATRSRPSICGVLVRPPKVGRSDGRAIVIPASNPVLIGAAPGEIEICAPRSDMRAGLCVGFPWFEPIWAIPADALRCDKRTARVLLIGSPQPVAEGKQQPNTRPNERRSRGAHAWCEAILTAGRKGLQAEPSRAEIADLWKAFKRSAKALRRSWR